MSNDDVTVRSANHIWFPFLSSNTKPGYEPSDVFQYIASSRFALCSKEL
jgi:hypothetical protein